VYKIGCEHGIAGLAKINGRGLLNWGGTLEWDKYVCMRSLRLNLKIVSVTLKYVITRRGRALTLAKRPVCTGLRISVSANGAIP